MSAVAKKTAHRIRKLKKPLLSEGFRRRLAINKNFRKGVIAFFVTLSLVAVVFLAKMPIRIMLNEGDIATDDVFAPYNFEYTAGIDEAKTKAQQSNAAREVLPVYDFAPGVSDVTRSDIEESFTMLKALKPGPAGISDADIEKLRADFPTGITPGDLRVLASYPDTDRLRDEVLSALDKSCARPIISDDDEKALAGSGKPQIVLYQSLSQQRSIEDVKGLATLSIARNEALLAASKADIEQAVKDVIIKLAQSYITVNASYSKSATDAAKQEAVSAVSPVYKVVARLKGEIIIRKGQKVLKDQMLQFDRISSLRAGGDLFSQVWGIAIIMFLMAFLLYRYFGDFETRIFLQDKLFLLVGVVIFMLAVAARFVVSSPLSSYLIPTAAAAMLITLLINGRVAAMASVLAAVIVGFIAGIKYNIFLISIISGITAICAVNGARHRNHIIKAGFYVGVVNFIAICAIDILANLDIRTMLKEGGWGFVCGVGSAAIAMLLLPLLESVFKLTTDIRLLELADLNHPLLREMVMKAPGTYHHSIVVGNLSEAAAEAVGANALLARIGSYYHDIGKIEKSEYFAENLGVHDDIHDKLSPTMSSLVITSHVKDGTELAEKYKLGSALKDIIEQHHGTSLVTYFYHQAVEKTQAETQISEERFRYPGPRPQTKESAIVMLADSVEAASRSVPDPAPQKLAELVRKIINAKFIDRQLDECELTLRDMSLISESFARVLAGIYHVRIEYPDDAKKT